MGHGYDFNPACSVLIMEAVKFLASTILHMFSSVYNNRRGVTSQVLPMCLQIADVKWLLLPAIFFTANNILVFLAISKNELSTFAVFQVTSVLWTAILWRFAFRTRLGWVRTAGVTIILIALVVNRLPSIGHHDEFTWAFLWILVLSIINSVGCVINEYGLKLHRHLDINLQNMVLYAGCTLCSFIFVLASDTSRITGGSVRFFDGFDEKTWITIGLQAAVGLLVGRMLKHADALMKMISISLRGPLVVFISPIFIHSPGLGAVTIISSLIAAVGCLTYLTMGPLKSEREIQEEEQKKKEDRLKSAKKYVSN